MKKWTKELNQGDILYAAIFDKNTERYEFVDYAVTSVKIFEWETSITLKNDDESQDLIVNINVCSDCQPFFCLESNLSNDNVMYAMNRRYGLSLLAQTKEDRDAAYKLILESELRVIRNSLSYYKRQEEKILSLLNEQTKG